MNRKFSSAVLAAAVIIILIGLLNVVLGAKAVISSAFPQRELQQSKLFLPSVEVGPIIFGLMMLAAGALWIMSGIGCFLNFLDKSLQAFSKSLTFKEWAPMLAIYVSPAIVAINIAGVLHLGGFIVNIGWASLSTVAGVGVASYLSKKELASFFLISVAEHTVIIIIFAMLIYAEPVDIAESEEKAFVVTIEKIEQQEKLQPLLAKKTPQKRTKLEKLPALPKMEIQKLTDTDPGAGVQGSVLQLPKTLARVTDTGEDAILRPPGTKKQEQRRQDKVPALDIDSPQRTLGSKKPSTGIVSPEKVKTGPEVAIVREPKYGRSDKPRVDKPSPDVRVVPPAYAGVARPGFAGEITGELAGRKVVFWPKPPEGYKGTQGGSVVIEFWVDSAGNVIRVEISKKSGSPRLDRMAEEYVKQLHFEELPKNVQQRVQSGKIPINFELTGRSE